MTEIQALKEELKELKDRIREIDAKLNGERNHNERLSLWSMRNHLTIKRSLVKKKLRNKINGLPANGYGDDRIRQANK